MWLHGQKDPSTQVGSVAVRNRTVIAQGYNGFPRGVDDHELYYLNKAIKYKRIVHAEMNAIYNAAGKRCIIKRFYNIRNRIYQYVMIVQKVSFNTSWHK